LSSLGIYDLALGSGKYILTSPLFNKATITRDNGQQINIEASNNSFDNKYISSVNIDGNYRNDVYVNQNDLLTGGDHTLSFTMSSTPTT
jgi:putative alpha-1,2-mannosidase